MDNSSFPAAVPSQTTAGNPVQPVGIFSVLKVSASCALRCWPALLLMLLGTLASAGLLALLPALNLLNLAHRPVIAEMAARIRAWQFVDLFGLLNSSQGTGSAAATAPPGFSDASMVFLAFVLMPLVGGIVSAFLYGGVLLTYREAAPEFRHGGSNGFGRGFSQGFSLRRFLWGCWHWFGANLLMAFIQAGVFMATFLPVLILVFLSQWEPVKTAAGLLLLVLDSLLWLMVFEVARVRMVANEKRNPFQAVGQSIHDLLHRPLPFLGFYTVSLAVLLGVQVIFRLVINPNLPLDALILALVVQQGFILARLFFQGVRLAGVMLLVKPEGIANDVV